ncbi:hypothetical protein AB4Z29_06840 [Paenibacillus sp. 2TAB23]|uniref:hypothetical protein n=1 Tax=Paenibacillus sp. 2TAB23 TaxID=3233004 RepID=UPI003F9C4855
MELKWKSSKQPLTQSQLLYMIGIALFAVLNLAGLFLYVLPELESLKLAKKDVVQFSATLQTVQNEYSTEKIPDDQIAKLETRVPLERVDSANLVFFHQIAAASETPLAYVKQATGNEGEQGQADSTISDNGTVTTSFEVVVVGHLPNLLTYIDQLHNFPRLFDLKKWSITDLTKEAITTEYPDLYTNPFIKKDQPILSLRMNIQSYIFSKFADAFHQDNALEEAPDKAI